MARTSRLKIMPRTGDEFEAGLYRDLGDAHLLIAEVYTMKDAHRLAALDDLLEACQQLLKMIDSAVHAGMNGSISNNCITTDKARAAIAKATGDAE